MALRKGFISGRGDSAMREIAKQLLKQAEKDFSVAKQNLKLGNYYITAFLCQQAAEKLLKAVLIIEEKKEPEKSHDLKTLVLALKNVDAKIKIYCSRINPHYFQARYPDAANGVPFEQYDEEYAEELVSMAGAVFAYFKKRDKLDELAKEA